MNRLVYTNKLGRNDLCQCRSGRKYRKCHSDFDACLGEFIHRGAIVPPRSIIKNQEQIQGIRESGKINIAILDYVSGSIKEGITTEQIDQQVYEQTIKSHAVPMPLNFEGFPKSVCTSVNDQVCHGILSPDVVLRQGDIVNVGVSTIYNGYPSDSSRMFCIGQVPEEKKCLVEVTRKSLDVGLKQVKPWGFLGDMGQAIRDFAEENGYTVVKEIGGHGVGLEFYEEPWVSYVSERGTEVLMVPGTVFTIEPIINMGSDEVSTDEEDGRTVYTEGGQPSAQWEIWALVAEEGYEVLAY